MLLRASMITALALLAAPASAQTLWRGFEGGMTADQVRAVDPRVAINPLASRERLKDGATCDLVLEGVEIDGRPYRGCFYFRGGRLAQIVLGDRGAPPAAFTGMVSRLARENGPDFAQAQSGRIQEARWHRADKTRVSVMYIAIGQPLTRIVYEPAGGAL